MPDKNREVEVLKEDTDDLSLSIIKKLRNEIQQNSVGTEVNNTNILNPTDRKKITDSFNDNHKEDKTLNQSYKQLTATDNSQHTNDSYNKKLIYTDNNHRIVQKSIVVIVADSKPTLTNCNFDHSQLIIINLQREKIKALPPVRLK